MGIFRFLFKLCYNDYMISLEDMNIFKNIKEIIVIEKGSTDRKKYKVVTEDEVYFVKVEDKIYSDKEILKVKWLYKTYQDLNIPVVPLIDLKVIDKVSVWIFPFFEGESLSEIELSIEQLESFGKLIALDIKKLNAVKLDTRLFPHFDFKLHYEERKNKLLDYIKNDKYYSIFKKIEWESILLKYQELYDSIKDNQVMLNHNDVKLKNFMIDKNLNYYFIDIDPFDSTFIGYNLGYSISCFLFKDKFNKEKIVLSSFIRTIDVSKELVNQFNYFLISDFINKFERYADYYLLNSNYIIELLLNDNNILCDIFY